MMNVDISLYKSRLFRLQMNMPSIKIVLNKSIVTLKYLAPYLMHYHLENSSNIDVIQNQLLNARYYID